MLSIDKLTSNQKVVESSKKIKKERNRKKRNTPNTLSGEKTRGKVTNFRR